MESLVVLGMAVLSVTVVSSAAPRGRAHPPPADSMAAVNNPATKGALVEKSAGPAALRAQILLDRAGFSVGQIDGQIGTNTLHAVTGYRTQQGLPPGGGFDHSFWQSINRDSAPALISYTITADDLKGPFVVVPADMMAQAKLDYLGYASPLDELSEKFHVSPALLQRLNHRSKCETEGEQIIVPDVGTPINGVAAKVVVSKSLSTVTAFDEAGKIIAQYPCSSGSEHDPLPIGEWKINGVAKNPKFHFDPDLFWNANATDAKAIIAAGPRNPVGVVWIDLSKDHYGIHGTPDPSQIGYAQSHGCIRLTNWDASDLARLVRPGTPAFLVE